MANYKEILRLHSLGINNTRVAESCGRARSTVISALQRAESLGVTWNDIKGLSEAEVAKKLYPRTALSERHTSWTPLPVNFWTPICSWRVHAKTQGYYGINPRRGGRAPFVRPLCTISPQHMHHANGVESAAGVSVFSGHGVGLHRSSCILAAEYALFLCTIQFAQLIVPYQSYATKKQNLPVIFPGKNAEHIAGRRESAALHDRSHRSLDSRTLLSNERERSADKNG